MSSNEDSETITMERYEIAMGILQKISCKHLMRHSGASNASLLMRFFSSRFRSLRLHNWMPHDHLSSRTLKNQQKNTTAEDHARFIF